MSYTDCVCEKLGSNGIVNIFLFIVSEIYEFHCIVQKYLHFYYLFYWPIQTYC